MVSTDKVKVADHHKDGSGQDVDEAVMVTTGNTIYVSNVQLNSF